MRYMVPSIILQRCKIISKSNGFLRTACVIGTAAATGQKSISQLCSIRIDNSKRYRRTLQCLSLSNQSWLNDSNKTLLLQLRSIHVGNGKEPENDESSGGNKTMLLLPPLMQFPTVMWPKITNSIRNWFFIHFVIKPYFDKEFSINDFMHGAHEAISLVATKLSVGELDDLEGLVEPLALSELRQTLSSFSVAQQDLLRVATEDIFFSFPYQIGIIIPDGASNTVDSYIESGQKPPPQTRHVEITVVLHVLRGMAEIQKKTDASSFSIVDFTKDESNKYKVMVCTYRFFRDFTVGCKDPSWIINMVNHFLPAEVPQS